MDRWSFWPGFVSLAIVAIVELLCQLPGSVSFVLIPVSLLGYAIALIVILATAVVSVVKRRPRRAASLSLVAMLPLLLWSPINWAADYVHLGLTAEYGIGQLGNHQKPSGDEFVVYDWSVGLVGGPNRFLIHDVTDEIALPLAQHKQPESFENGFGEACAGKVRRLLSHYYVCTF